LAWIKRGPELLVGVPFSGRFSGEWVIQFRNMIINVPHLFCFMGTTGEPLDNVRNRIAQTALDNGVRHLLFVDADSIVPNDLYTRLASHNLPIVSALYHRRHPDYREAMWKLHPTPKPGAKYMAPGPGTWSYQKGTLIEVDVVGCGAVLIHTDVLRKVPKPWFKWNIPWTGEQTMDSVSEDFWFFERAREAGFKVIVDTGLIVEHEFEGKVDGEGKIVKMNI